MENRQRIDLPDVMKGICIIGVVVQHFHVLPQPEDNLLIRIWFALNMPLFFFVSGMFLPVKRSLGCMIVHSGHRLLVPWVVFSVGAGLSVYLLQGRDIELWRDLHHWLFVGPNVPLYFLRSLFMALIVAWCAARLCRSLWAQAAAMVVFMASSWAVIRLNPQWGIDYGWREAISMLMYMWAGHMLVSVATVERLTLSRRAAVDVLLLALLAACLLNPAPMRWHYQDTWGCWAVITMCAILGIIAVWALGCLLREFRPLAYVGRMSLQILVTHYWLMVLFIVLLATTRQVAALPTIALLPLAVYVCERYLPGLFGRRKRRKNST